MSERGCSEEGQFTPDHVINHPADGDLQSAQRFVGRQNVGQAGEAEHAGDGEEHLGKELGILSAPLASLCAGSDGGVAESQEG